MIIDYINNFMIKFGEVMYWLQIFACKSSDLRSSLLQFGTRPNEWGTQWDTNSLTTRGSLFLSTPPLGQDMTQDQLTGLNSEFSFSKTSFLTKAEEPSLPYYFTHCWKENNWIHTFPKGISAMWNAMSLVQDLNSCRRVHFLRR